MNKEEYLNRLVSQIRYKKAHDPIRKEIEAHIEDQAEAYEMDGMAYEDALEEAVAEMGDPIQVGGELDHIHRPVTPYRLLLYCGAAGLLCLFLRMFMQMNHEELFLIMHDQPSAFVTDLNMMKEFFHWILGVLVMVAVCRLDYSFFARKGEIVSGIIILIFIFGRRNLYYGAYMWLEIVPGIRFSSIHILLLFIPLYAAEVYKCRGSSIKMLLIRSIYWIIIPMYWAYTIPSIYVMIILALAFMSILSIAAWKNWFSVNKGKALAAIWGIPFVLCSALGTYIICFTNGYKSMRLKELLFHDASMNNPVYQTIHNVLINAKLWGKIPEATFDMLSDQLSMWDYFLLYLIAHLGYIAAILVIGILLGLVIWMGILSVKQKNQMGMLIGTGCSIVFLIEILLYVMANLGFTLFGSGYCPFLTYGGTGTVMTYALCGIMLSIIRYERVFPEKDLENRNAKILQNV